MSERDWMAALATMLRQDTPRPTMTSEQVDAMIDGIVSGRIQAPAPSGLRRRRQRRWIAGGIAFGVLAGGATAAAVWNSRRAEQPQQGVACHASAALDDTQTVVIEPNVDPIAACERLWESGDLLHTSAGTPTGSAPTMFVCVGPGGGLEVFPRTANSATGCPDLGLADAAVDAVEEPLVALRRRLVDEVNLQCVDLEAARLLASAAIADLGLTEWTVTSGDNPGGCVKAVEDPETKSIRLFTL